MELFGILGAAVAWTLLLAAPIALALALVDTATAPFGRPSAPGNGDAETGRETDPAGTRGRASSARDGQRAADGCAC